MIRTPLLNGTARPSLPFPVQNGTFLVHVRDQATGQTTTRMIEVDLDGLNDDDTTLNSLAAALDNVPGISAAVTGDNRLQLSADSGFEVSFSEDSSHALAALGVGTFFDGTNAATIAVNSAVQDDPRLLATSLDGTPGDGRNAGRLAAGRRDREPAAGQREHRGVSRGNREWAGGGHGGSQYRAGGGGRRL